jgi:HSP20 family protein
MATPNEPAQTQSRSQQAAGRSQNDGTSSAQSNQGSQTNETAGRQRPQGRAISRGPERRDLSTLASNPFEVMRRMSRDMDRMMSAFLGGSPVPRAWESEWATPTMWVPRLDVEQRGDSICVRADLPGVRKEDVQIEVTDEGLTLSGERREEREEGGENQGYRSIERSYGSFYRTIPLPQKVNLDQLKAKMRDGVLEITVPLDESARARRIQIEG